MTEPSVRIRMYRQGLGDCFLLSLPRPADQPDFHMLVDCGVLQRTNTTRIIAAVNDIKETTGGHLDLVVMTHEHEDHISGFRQAREIFKDISVDRVWLGWTEDPENPMAVQLRKDRAVRLRAVNAAVTQMAKLNLTHLTEKDLAKQTAQMQSIEEMLRFVSLPDEEDAPPSGLAAVAQNPRPVAKNPMVEFALAKGLTPTYWYPTHPDRPHQQEIVPGVRAYVFGPPEDPRVFVNMDPTRKGKETYSVPAFGAEDAFVSAVSENSNPATPGSLLYPFDDLYRITPEDAQTGASGRFFADLYGFQADDADKYRRIDADWLDNSSELALKLVDGTNNTSLVLALEVGNPGEGKVILLAADAQVGNWLSWGPLQWTVQTASGENREIKTAQLLARTVLYKVGHHGSDNATLRAQGLELMLDENLVAMLPVDEDAAAHVKGENKPGWKMPAAELYTRLKEKTKGRVLRADKGLPPREDAVSLKDEEWQSFANAVTETDLYIEYKI